MSIALFLFALSQWFIFTEGKANETCDGIRREDHSYDFQLPHEVAMEVQHDECDAEWTVDRNIAILEGDQINFSLPFKNVTRQGISVSYCPALVKYHVICPQYNKELDCSCTNFTANPPLNSSLPSKDIFLPSDLSVRHHYCVIPVAGFFFLILILILTILFCKGA